MCSFMTSLPGPQVGRLANEQMIFPPVDCNADKAASIVGNNAGSGFLIWENNVGIRAKSEAITALRRSVNAISLESVQYILGLVRIDK